MATDTRLDDLQEEEDTLKGKYLTFPLGKEEYGLEIRHVTEIVGVQKITEVPDMPPFIRGVINLRGKVIPVMDVRARFGMPAKEYDDHTCIIVVNINDASVGIVVDTVSEVISIPSEDVDPPPSLRKGEESRFVKGLGKVGKEVKILLEIQQLLYSDDSEKLSESMAE